MLIKIEGDCIVVLSWLIIINNIIVYTIIIKQAQATIGVLYKIFIYHSIYSQYMNLYKHFYSEYRWLQGIMIMIIQKNCNFHRTVL